jgi:intracellular sulfur oxidation DsrE/DsrF family protein
MEALKTAAIDVLACGQSLRSRKVAPSELCEGTVIAHSALTAITDYVSQGYVFSNLLIRI